jgi:hypothetical protein
MFRQQALEDSAFDPLQLRRGMWQQLETGTAKLLCKSCEFAKVLYIHPVKARDTVPWDLWARIFQAFGKPNDGHIWRVFWFPAEAKRQYPPIGTPITPAAVNGGYSYPCRSDTIVIYRAEEATRVLLHELLHAACCDPHGECLEKREANTETWAELLLVGLLSEGSLTKANQLWKIQAQWIANQNAILRKRFGITNLSQYAWRYTLGREEVLATLGIQLPEPISTKQRSSRLTSPELWF